MRWDMVMHVTVAGSRSRRSRWGCAGRAIGAGGRGGRVSWVDGTTRWLGGGRGRRALGAWRGFESLESRVDVERRVLCSSQRALQAARAGSGGINGPPKPGPICGGSGVQGSAAEQGGMEREENEDAHCKASCRERLESDLGTVANFGGHFLGRGGV